jgi:hypothetical protein
MQFDMRDSLLEDPSTRDNPAWKSKEDKASEYIVREQNDSLIKMNTSFSSHPP